MTRDRRGYALVEMLLIMSALAVILGLCAGLIHTLLRLDRVARGHLAEVSRRDQIARQFRRDVRAASDWKPRTAESTSRLVLTGPGGVVVEYEVRRGQLERTEHVGERVVRRERYKLRSVGAPRFVIQGDGPAVFASLVFGPTSSAKDPLQRREFRVEALAGRDRRLARSKETAR